jgi:hypothetical protein
MESQLQQRQIDKALAALDHFSRSPSGVGGGGWVAEPGSSGLGSAKYHEQSHTGIHSLPDEVMLKIAGELQSDQSVPRSILLGMCKQNHQFARAGQETLFKECDLSTSPTRSPYLLMRSLFESPVLRVKVRKLTITTETFAVRPSEFQEILLMLLEHVRKLPLDGAQQNLWQSYIEDYEPEAWLCVLFSLTPRLRHLCLQVSSGPVVNAFFQRLSEFQLFGDWFANVRKIEASLLRGSKLPLQVPQQRSGLTLHLPNLKTLTLSARRRRQSRDISQVFTGPITASLRRCENLSNLELRRHYTIMELRHMLETMSGLRSLTYNGPGGAYLYIPEAFPETTIQSLQHLKINADDDSRINVWWWPQNFHLLTALKTFEIQGSLRLDFSQAGYVKEDAEHNIRTMAADFFPPNVEHILISPGSYEDYVPGFGLLRLAFETFFEDIESKRPCLRSVKIGGSLRGLAEKMIEHGIVSGTGIELLAI